VVKVHLEHDDSTPLLLIDRTQLIPVMACLESLTMQLQIKESQARFFINRKAYCLVVNLHVHVMAFFYAEAESEVEPDDHSEILSTSNPKFALNFSFSVNKVELPFLCQLQTEPPLKFRDCPLKDLNRGNALVLGLLKKVMDNILLCLPIGAVLYLCVVCA
jgi:hypothetical protein